MKKILCVLVLLLQSAWALDLTRNFQDYYRLKTILSPEELKYLADIEIILVPGILSESFRWEDHRGTVDFSLLMGEYFRPSHRHLTKNLKLKAHRIFTSSADIQQTKKTILSLLNEIKDRGNRAIFLSHSLGGLVTLDTLLENQQERKIVEGVIFLQSPFFGSPIAQVVLDYPYYSDKWLRPLLPFFNTSEETITYLSPSYRATHMRKHSRKIQQFLRQIPAMSFTSRANGSKSLFQPAIDVMRSGCIKSPGGKCLTKNLFEGPYDDSDGMVPVKSSLLPGSDFVHLHDVDHGEPVLHVLGKDIDKATMTEVLLKMILEKISYNSKLKE